MLIYRNAPAAGLAGLLLFALAGPAAGQGYFDEVGYTALKARLGSATPTGAGIAVTQVEAQVSANAYLPDQAAFPNTTITDRSGGGLVSGHATGVGAYFYGPTDSMTPGVPQVDAYKIVGRLEDGSFDPGDWLVASLRVGTALPPVVDTQHRVQNHSYIGTAPAGDPDATEAVRRYDLAIRRDNIVGVVAVNNGTGPVPAYMAGGYNSIAVGLTGGNSSIGPTTFTETDGTGSGRSKPDIVAPLGVTSDATPVVASAAVLLVATAAGKADAGERVRAGRVETIKAALLSGATKEEFAGRSPPWQRVNNGTFVEPLDRRFGAGELNIDRSHRILSAPEQNGTDLASDAPAGWDFETLTVAGPSRRYFLDVPADATGAKLTATADWLRRVTQVGTTLTATLSRVELRLYEADAAGNLGPLIDASLSPVDNVQHVYADVLPGRRYALEVTAAAFPLGQGDEDVAVAWFASFAPVPEPGGILAVLAVVAAAARFRYPRG